MTDNNGQSSSGSRRLAAIDIGTNSIRLIVAEANADGNYRLLDDEKETTRLGQGLENTGECCRCHGGLGPCDHADEEDCRGLRR